MSKPTARRLPSTTTLVVSGIVVVILGSWVLMAGASQDSTPTSTTPTSTTVSSTKPASTTTSRTTAASTDTAKPAVKSAEPPKPATEQTATTERRESSNPFSAIREGFRDVRTAVRGTLRENIPSALPGATPAVRRAFKAQGLTLVRDVSDTTSATLETRMADGEALTVTVRVNGTGTELAIQIGAFGDQERAKQVMEWIKAKL